ncbi:M14 family zinc carboxypeptidase [Vibrio salinus]|uniref:M14 family zinc carboxypeptidase n=1 Tax=Vibrio salinus TaxID=2899784 RepID=UPI001E4C31D2|nr:M14 family zinc carboxypeptidase [Vibrio salinus]MCE0495677.1 peptidase M14 [Vibrio salinus]
MNTIYSGSLPTTLSQLLDEFSVRSDRPARVHVWVFADKKSRRLAEQSLEHLGIEARMFSAYKPLLHYFLETLFIDERGFERVEVIYPKGLVASENRFLLESYPLAGLIEDGQLDFIPSHQFSTDYQVRIHRKNRETELRTVFAPNHIHLSVTGEKIQTPTGWIRAFDESGVCIKDERLKTDFELAFETIIKAVSTHEWPQQSPYFEQLRVRVEVPAEDEPVGYGHESVSLQEVLHEDIYFTLQEWFKYKEGKDLTARNSQPGQIVPQITYGSAHEYRIDIRQDTYERNEQSDQADDIRLNEADRPLPISVIENQLNQISGEGFSVGTPSGRKVFARYRTGTDKPVMISGGQHANETTGVVGALRAAGQLDGGEQAHFIVAPLSNPDGYALHQKYIRESPYHIHHAARYTALGDDLEYRTQSPFYEKNIRIQARGRSGADLHINLHGYPSHEWTRPLSGYVPNGFAMWTIPKGFFLVMRYKDEPYWATLAERFIGQLTLALNEYPDVMKMNRSHINTYQRHAGETGFKMINRYPCILSPVTDYEFPLQLITEYPDETIYGQDFIDGHTIQTATVLAAYRIYQSLV